MIFHFENILLNYLKIISNLLTNYIIIVGIRPKIQVYKRCDHNAIQEQYKIEYK